MMDGPIEATGTPATSSIAYLRKAAAWSDEPRANGAVAALFEMRIKRRSNCLRIGQNAGRDRGAFDGERRFARDAQACDARDAVTRAQPQGHHFLRRGRIYPAVEEDRSHRHAAA